MRTELPEKWFIRADEENYRPIYDFINFNYSYVKYNYNLNSWCLADINTFICFPGINEYHQSSGDGTYEEITFEEFTHFILKEKLPKENYKYLTTFLRKLNIT